MTPPKPHSRALSLLLPALLFLAGCAGSPSPTAAVSPSSPSSTPTSSPSLTPAEPTQTPVPLAATVNGEGIPLADFQAELERFNTAQAALGKTPTPDEAKQIVLADLIDRALLAQAAAEGGFQVDDSTLQARIDRLADQAGGAQALKDWQAAHGYTEEAFRAALRLEVCAAWQRDQVISQVPEAAEQVHVRQILLASQDDAGKVLERLQSGTKFATLAYKYDPVTGGDLGWFPRGYLDLQEVESAAFALQPEQTSQVISSKVGYHVIQMIERDPQRPLNSDQRIVLQKKALQKWLEDRRAASQVVVIDP